MSCWQLLPVSMAFLPGQSSRCSMWQSSSWQNRPIAALRSNPNWSSIFLFQAMTCMPRSRTRMPIPAESKMAVISSWAVFSSSFVSLTFRRICRNESLTMPMGSSSIRVASSSSSGLSCAVPMTVSSWLTFRRIYCVAFAYFSRSSRTSCWSSSRVGSSSSLAGLFFRLSSATVLLLLKT